MGLSKANITSFKKGNKPWNKGRTVNLLCKCCGNMYEVDLYRKNISNFCSNKCRVNYFKGKELGKHSRAWKGGRTLNGGYVYIYCPDHPNNNNGYVSEHRLVMEKHIGRTLLPTEIVHHINRDISDNRIENLMLFPGCGEHIRHHAEVRNGKISLHKM